MKDTTYITIENTASVDVTIRANSIERIFDSGLDEQQVDYKIGNEVATLYTNEDVFEKLNQLTDFLNIS